jgi:hypothetical protein
MLWWCSIAGSLAKVMEVILRNPLSWFVHWDDLVLHSAGDDQ